MTEIWGRRAFCQFGQGDIDLDGFLTAVGEVGYDGWLVVEQDIFPRADEPADVPAKAQEANLAFLRAGTVIDRKARCDAPRLPSHR